LVECEFISRDKDNPQKAGVQVKAIPKIDPSDYQEYVDNGYNVYFYDGGITKDIQGVQYISKSELLQFFNEYKSILPDSITKWEKLFK
jgi:hypothetical protein